MIVAMMEVRIVRVGMPGRCMAMPMRVRLGYRAIVGVLVMRIMNVDMLVLHGVVGMFVVMALRQMQPETKSHQ